jgi:hypothetical protein
VPVLRPADHTGPIPVGWVAEPIGDWNGAAAQVAYDPRLYDVQVVASDLVDDREHEMIAAGWAYAGTDGISSMWLRDRAAAARAALRQASAPADDRRLGGPER